MKLSLHDKSILYRELAKLTGAGFGFDKSADLLRQQAPNRATAVFAGEALRRIQAGQSIAQAIRQPELGLRELDHQVVQAAEQGGVLETGFSYLRDHYAAALRNRNNLRARMLYPALLLPLAALLPAVPPLLLGQAAGAELRECLLLFAGLVLAGTLGWLAWNKLEQLAASSLVADHILRRIPLLGRARTLASLQRFAAVFRISLLAARRTSEALQAAAAAAGSAILNRAALRLAKHAEQGGALADLLPGVGELPPDFRRSLASAEISGALEQDLEAWTAAYRHDLDLHMVKAGTLLPMVATAAVAVFVAWRVVSVYSGMLHTQMEALENL